VERAYEASISVRFVVSADDPERTAETFVSQLAAWVDGSLGSPPFAPWLTAWVNDSPTPLDAKTDTWMMRRVTEDELAHGRLWRDHG
jgi:hypothetical protein